MMPFLSLPFIVFSRLIELFRSSLFLTDLEHCLEVVDAYGNKIPPAFIEALVAAEDHRNRIHFGVDPFGIMRALFVRIIRKENQGASTIEQQFVRVVTNKYEHSMLRKLREQALAIAVSRRRPKSFIASAYLSIAFYGSGCIGLQGLRSLLGNNLDVVEPHAILTTIAQLKYPKPLRPSISWKRLIARRTAYIALRQEQLTALRMEVKSNRLTASLESRSVSNI